MKDTLLAYLVTGAAVAPTCTVCVLGPTAIFSWLGGWLGGLSPTAAIGLAAAAILAYGFRKRRPSRLAHGRNTLLGHGAAE